MGRSLRSWGWVVAAGLAAPMSAGIVAGCNKPKVTPDNVDDVLTLLREEPKPAAALPIWSKERLYDPDDVKTNGTSFAGRFWRRFRDAYPVGLQAIAVSDPGADGSPAVVIAEPPPHVSLDDIHKLVPDAKVARQADGFDGGLMDAVGTLPADAKQRAGVLANLNLLLFRTNYKAYVLHEPFKPVSFPKGLNLNRHPSAAEVHQWVTGKDATFVPLSQDATLTYAQLRATTTSEVYRRQNGDLIAWWIPEGTPISDCLVQGREFALESDLIAGAIRDGGLLICGRKRLAAYDVLPPIRMESVALLAALQDRDQLAQSYQRNHAAAGPYTEQYDWAPILLSPELVNTEYGHLLNVADQMLKGWSSAGRVHYIGFAYAKPEEFAFNNRALLDIVSEHGSHEVTFNWNTTGAAYGTEFGQAKVYVPNRTGALPVSYIPGETAKGSAQQYIVHYEDLGYDYFAGLENPVLARVVQYASLFQIFHTLKVDKPTETAPAVDKPQKSFAESMGKFWEKVQNADEAYAKKIAQECKVSQGRSRAYLDTVVAQFKERNHYDSADPETRAAIDKAVAGFYQKSDSSDADETMRAYAAWRSLSDEDRAAVAKVSKSLSMDDVDPADADRASAALARSKPFIVAAASVEKLADHYSSEVPLTGHSWIHTPTVVLSNNGKDSYFLVGGHNVYADVEDIVFDASVPPKAVRVDADGKVRMNPSDSGRLDDAMVHDIGRIRHDHSIDPTEASARLTTSLGKRSLKPPQPPDLALGFPTAGFDVEAPPLAALGARRRPTVHPEAPERFILVTSDEKGYCVAEPGSKQYFGSDLSDVSALLHAAAAHGEPVGVRFVGMDEKAVQAALDNLRKGNPDTVGIIEPEDLPKDFMSRDRFDFHSIRYTTSDLKQVGDYLEATIQAVVPTRGAPGDLSIDMTTTFGGQTDREEDRRVIDGTRKFVEEKLTQYADGRASGDVLMTVMLGARRVQRTFSNVHDVRIDVRHLAIGKRYVRRIIRTRIRNG